MPIKRLAIITVHTSPLAKLGGAKAGGMNVYINEIAQELGRRGIAIDIFTRRSSTDQAEIDFSLGANVRVIHITAGPPETLPPEEIFPYLSPFLAGMIAFATQHSIQYDLIYSHYWLSGWVANRLKEIWGTPFVQMFHTLGQMKNRVAPGYVQAMMPDQRTRTELQIVRSADRLIAATPAERAQLLWLYRANRRKIEIVPPGVNSHRFHPIPMEQAKSELGVPLNANLLVFAGRIEPLKAIDTILEALSLIQQNTPNLMENLCFRVIGGNIKNPSDAELKRLRSLSDDLGLQKVVQFLGAKEQADLQTYYAASLAVIVPSDYESFGMVALEAMASGAPVIASYVGGLAFLVRDGETGFLVPTREPAVLAQRITSLLLEPERRHQMGNAAARLARNYMWPVITDRLLSIFDQLISPTATISRHTN